MAANTKWKIDGLCAGRHELFDAVEVETSPDVFVDTYPHLVEAKAICDACPVFAQCAAQRKRERSGIWAGKSARY